MMSSGQKSLSPTFSEPKTRTEWSHLRKNMKAATHEDYSSVDLIKFTEFKRAATSDAPYYKGIILGLIIWAVPFILIKIAERIFVFRAGSIFYVAIIILIFTGIFLQASLARKHQKKIIDLGKDAGIIL